MPRVDKRTGEEDSDWHSKLDFPKNVMSRGRFKLSDGKPLSGHQWKVYDYISNIPRGRVTTYAALAKALNSSPRAVGGALRNNPFAPSVPCHRIIASTLMIGGFQGEWTDVKSGRPKKSPTGDSELKLGRKRQLLEEEGVFFDDKGRLMDSENVLWQI